MPAVGSPLPLAPAPLHQRLAGNLARLPDDEQRQIAGVLRQVATMMEEAAPPPA